jgi:multisubunit Na+/H+ antiporter MnhE subunit
MRFAVALVISGLQTLQVILFQRQAPNAGFIRMRFAPMTDTGASVLGALITLTPGTTTVDIDMDERELLLHLLDTSDAAGAVAGIRRDFEAPLVILFGTEVGS